MRPLIVLSARAVGAALLLMLALGVAAGGVRLLPWLFAPEVPLRLALPFGRLLLAHALDAAVGVGLPVGLVLAAATFVERGEARALEALGASPLRLLLPALAVSALTCSLNVGASAVLDSEGPGRFSAELLDEGRVSCAGSEGGRRVEIPLAGVTWLCFEPVPRLVGRVPGVGADAWFSASAVRLSADLGEIDVEGLSLAFRAGSRSAMVRAPKALLVGLPVWGDRGGAAGPLRAARSSLAAAAFSVVAVVLVLRGRQGQLSPVGAAVAAALGAVVLLAALRQLEAHRAAFSVPGSAAVAALAAATTFWLGFALVRGRRATAVARPSAP